MKVCKQVSSIYDGTLVAFVPGRLHDGEAEWMSPDNARRFAAEILMVCDDADAVDAEEDERRRVERETAK